MKTNFIIVFLVVLIFACNTKKHQSNETKIIRDTIANTQHVQQDVCVDCIGNKKPIIIQPVWIDSMKTKLSLDITYTNVDSLPHIVWVGFWLVVLLDNDDKKLFLNHGLYYNKIYITKAGEKIELRYHSIYGTCYKVPRGIEIENYCFQNYKILNFGDCFKVSIQIDDQKIIGFIKKHSFKITLIHDEYLVHKEDLYPSNVQLLSKENKNWYSKNCLGFKLDTLFECYNQRKMYYGSFEMNHKYRSLIWLDDIFDRSNQIVDLGTFKKLKLSQIPKRGKN